ncbi:MAG: hypothetical protein HKP43_10190 [Altererythrobacter sp.]|nr:hypothetical protein [Altererythrobacter sp.]
MALRREFGGWGLTLHAEQGDGRLGFAQRAGELFEGERNRFPTQTFGIVADRHLGALAATLGISWMHEDRSVLGAQLHPAIGQNGADTLFVDANLRWDFGRGWQLGGQTRVGITQAVGSEVISSGSQFVSNAWALDIMRASVLRSGDTLGLRISQTLRVETGGLRLNLPSSFDYATEAPGYSIQRLSLAPEGRELVSELAWQGPLDWGRGGASVFYRYQPGHYADGPDDVGAVVSFSADF